jgi:hypothetical protein
MLAVYSWSFCFEVPQPGMLSTLDFKDGRSLEFWFCGAGIVEYLGFHALICCSFFTFGPLIPGFSLVLLITLLVSNML